MGTWSVRPPHRQTVVATIPFCYCKCLVTQNNHALFPTKIANKQGTPAANWSWSVLSTFLAHTPVGGGKEEGGKQRKGGGKEGREKSRDVANAPSATTLKQGSEGIGRAHTPLTTMFRNGNLSVLGSLQEMFNCCCMCWPSRARIREWYVCNVRQQPTF